MKTDLIFGSIHLFCAGALLSIIIFYFLTNPSKPPVFHSFIFGFNLFINNRYVHTYTYLSNDDEYALKPTDKSFISSDAIIESYQIMLKYIFNDCEKIKPLIEEFTNKENAKKKYAELQLQIKAVKKEKDLTKVEEKNKILKLNEDYFTEPYVKMIEEYKKSCK